MPRQFGPTMRTFALARGLDELLLQRLAFRADLAEAAGEHERERDPGLPALLDRARHVRRGQGDQRHVAGLAARAMRSG